MNIIRKYQPKELDDFISNKKIISSLKSISKKKIIPNIMISANYGSGKTQILKIFVESLNIKKTNILHINLNEDLKKNNILNNKLFNFLKKSEKNVIIIDNYEEIPLEQQYILRSLIKNYNNNSIFIFSLNNISNIIEQLSSYFLIFKLKPHTNTNFFKYLKNIVETEKLNINDSILNYIIEISHNFREVINNFTIILNFYSTNDSISNNDLEKCLNVSDKKHAYDIINYCDKGDIYNVINIVNELINDGFSITDLINILTVHIKSIKSIKYEKVIKYIELISFAQIKMTNNLNTYTQLCSLIAKMCKV